MGEDWGWGLQWGRGRAGLGLGAAVGKGLGRIGAAVGKGWCWGLQRYRDWGPEGARTGRCPGCGCCAGCSKTPSHFPAWDLAARLCSAGSRAVVLPETRTGFWGWGPIRSDLGMQRLSPPPGVTCLLGRAEAGNNPRLMLAESTLLLGGRDTGAAPTRTSASCRAFYRVGPAGAGGNVASPGCLGTRSPCPAVSCLGAAAAPQGVA